MAHPEEHAANSSTAPRSDISVRDDEEMESKSDESGTRSVLFDVESNPIFVGSIVGAGSCSIHLALRTAIFHRLLKSIAADPARSIRDLDDFACSVISTINASFTSLMSLNVIRLKLWNSPVRSRPSVLFLTYCSVTGYMVADTIGKVACWAQFRGGPDGWKLSKIYLFHHLLCCAAGAFQFPNPEYCMLLFGLFLAAEGSNVPLNLMTIGKFLRFGPRFREHCKLTFFIVWMTTRVPLCFFALYYSVRYHREIMEQGKTRGIVMGVGNTVGAVLMASWTLVILKKFIAKMKGLEQASKPLIG